LLYLFDAEALYIIAVLEKVSDGTIDSTDVVGAMISIARMAEEHMGGTSGALYSSVFPTTCIFSNLQSVFFCQQNLLYGTRTRPI
jgi:hypothetical protein